MPKDWQSAVKNLDVIVILVSSAGAIILYHLGILPEEFVVSFILFILAAHTVQEVVRGEEIRKDVKAVSRAIAIPKSEIDLIKPSELLQRTAEFALRNKGEEWWFNTCASMFRSKELFNSLLRASIENQKTTKITFIMRPSMKEIWEQQVQPMIDECRGKEKVQPPIWTDIEEGISFRMIDVDSGKMGKEALLTFWGEPFMMEHVAEERMAHMPRYVLHVKHDSELLHRLKDIFMKHRLKRAAGVQH